MLHATYQIITGKSNKGNEFKALKFIINTPVGRYESGLSFPTPMEMAIIEKYSSDDVSDKVKSIYSGETSPEIEGF